MIKLIACDMDGTLLDENGKIDDEFFEVFEKLMERDIKFAVASGRQYNQLLRNFEDVGDNVIYIAENGTIVKHKGRELHSTALNNEDVMAIVRDCSKIEGTFLVLCGKNCAYTNIDKAREELLGEIKKYYLNYEIIEDFSCIKDEILKIAVLDLKGSQDNSYKILYPRWKDKLNVAVSGRVWLDIYSKAANKGMAIKLLQKMFGIKKEETMVFGDYFNDIEMLEEADYSYAMENSPEEVKKYANFVAKSNRESGVLEILKKVVLKA